MKKILLAGLLLASCISNAQWDSRSGILIGGNEYYSDANFLSSRSKPGFTIGLVTTLPVSEHSEFLAELNYSKFNNEFLGREDMLAEPEWLQFSMDRINFTIVYDYDLLRLLNDDLVFGLNAGPSFSVLNDWNNKDDSKENYLMDPYLFDAQYMKYDTWSQSTTINVFGAFGLSARFKNFEANLRYYKGLTNTHRNVPLSSGYMELQGKDNYSTFTLTYYFEQPFY